MQQKLQNLAKKREEQMESFPPAKVQKSNLSQKTHQHELFLKQLDLKRREHRAEFHIKQRDNIIQ